MLNDVAKREEYAVGIVLTRAYQRLETKLSPQFCFLFNTVARELLSNVSNTSVVVSDFVVVAVVT